MKHGKISGAGMEGINSIQIQASKSPRLQKDYGKYENLDLTSRNMKRLGGLTEDNGLKTSLYGLVVGETNMPFSLVKIAEGCKISTPIHRKTFNFLTALKTELTNDYQHETNLDDKMELFNQINCIDDIKAQIEELIGQMQN